MKNLKKLLALMLVLVLALGMVPMVATASDDGFTDADDIEFVEAADVLKALGVIVGYTDGSYQPKQNVTRAEAVAYIVRMLLTPSVANRLPDNRSSFTDVLSNPSAAWAAGEIEYAFGEGIVYGRGEGLFDPQGSVTGIEMAAFLLRALGTGKYDNPATWAINAVADGTRMGILNIGDDVDLAAPAIRDQVGFYTFNSLIYSETTIAQNVVKYQVTLMTGTDPGSAANEVPEAALNKLHDTYQAAVNAARANTVSTVTVGVNFTVTDITITEEIDVDSIADKIFGMKRAVGESDDFGRPGLRVWIYQGQEISSVITSAPVLTYEAQVRVTTIFADLGLRQANDASTFIDGVSSSATTVSHTSSERLGGNGVLTEVYRAGNGDLTIVIINTYVGTVTNVAAATAVTEERVTIAPEEGAKLTGFINGTFDAKGFSANDVVLYTVAQTAANTFAVKSVELAEKATLTPSAYTTGTSFVADGVTYRYNANRAGTAVSANNVPIDVWFDSFGFVIKVSDHDAVANYAVLIAAGTLNDGFGNITNNARLFMPSGESEDYRATADVSGILAEGGDGYTHGKIVTYTPASGGRYTIASATSISGIDVDEGFSANVSITNGNPRFTLGANSYNANASTVFVVRTGTSPSWTYTAYTGFAGTDGVPSLSATGTANFEAVVNTRTGVAQLVYITGAQATAAATNLIFLSGLPTNTTTEGTSTFYDATAAMVMVNGEPTAMRLHSSTDPAPGLYKSMTTTNGIVTLDDKVTLQEAESLIRSGSTITIGVEAFTEGANIQVYTYNTATGVVTPSTSAVLPSTLMTRNFFYTTVGNSGVAETQLASFWLDVTPFSINALETNPIEPSSGPLTALRIQATYLSVPSTVIAGTTVTVTLTLTNAPAAAGTLTFTVAGTDVSPDWGAGNDNTWVVTGLAAGDTKTFTFEMPSASIEDFDITATSA